MSEVLCLMAIWGFVAILGFGLSVAVLELIEAIVERRRRGK